MLLLSNMSGPALEKRDIELRLADGNVSLFNGLSQLEVWGTAKHFSPTALLLKASGTSG